MRDIIEGIGNVVIVTALVLACVIALFGESSEGSHTVYKRCVEVGVEIEKCNTIAGFEKGEKE